MSTGEGNKKKLGNIKTIIYGRTVMILLGFLGQLVLLALGYFLLRNYSLLLYGLFLFISAVAIQIGRAHV